MLVIVEGSPHTMGKRLHIGPGGHEQVASSCRTTSSCSSRELQADAVRVEKCRAQFLDRAVVVQLLSSTPFGECADYRASLSQTCWYELGGVGQLFLMLDIHARAEHAGTFVYTPQDQITPSPSPGQRAPISRQLARRIPCSCSCPFRNQCA